MIDCGGIEVGEMQQTFQCYKCGAQNYVGEPACWNCKSPFQWNCPNCKAPIQNTMVNCPQCHVLLTWSTQQQYQQQNQQSNQVGRRTMANNDLRSTVPGDIANRLMPDEQVLYYASGGGCLFGPRTYFLLTDHRAMLTGITNGGCLGIGAKTAALDIPLEHITSTGTEQSGCIISKQGIVTVSSGTATQRVLLSSPQAAEEASMTLQQLLRERRNNK